MDFRTEKQRFERMLELLKSRQHQQLLRAKKNTFDLVVVLFYPSYFYCFAYEIITWPKCILVCSITVMWCKINVECGYLFENRCDANWTEGKWKTVVARVRYICVRLCLLTAIVVRPYIIASFELKNLLYVLRFKLAMIYALRCLLRIPFAWKVSTSGGASW